MKAIVCMDCTSDQVIAVGDVSLPAKCSKGHVNCEIVDVRMPEEVRKREVELTIALVKNEAMEKIREKMKR